MEIIFHSHANKTRFHKKGYAPSLILKVRVFGTRGSGLLYMIISKLTDNTDLSPTKIDSARQLTGVTPG